MLAELLLQLAYWFPYYVLLVLVPAAARLAIERAMGIDHTEFQLPPPAGMAYEEAYNQLVRVGLYYPLFEELVFRGAPLLLLGPAGLAVGSAVWVLLHPAWQLRYLSHHPLWRRVAFTVTCSTYYALNAVFYSLMWLSGAGLAAIVYHAAHNTLITLTEILPSLEMPPLLPRRRRFVEEAGAPRRFVRRR